MARDSAPPRRIWQLPTFILGLAAVWAAATTVAPPLDAAARLTTRLDDLAAALERKPVHAAELEPLVKLLAETPSPTPRSHYLLGSAYVALAMQMPTEAVESWMLALQHFEACDVTAMTLDDVARLNYRQAKANAAMGRGEPLATITAIMNSPPGEDRSECPRLIAECALRLPKPDLARARDELTNYLGGQNRATPAAADRYKLKLAELNQKLGDPERARRWLTDISPSAPPEVQVATKTTLARQAFEEKNWLEAIALSEAALAFPTAPKNALRYQIGEAYTNMGNPQQAIAYFEQASKEPGAIGGRAAMRVAEQRRRGEAVDWLERGVAQLPANAISADDQRIAQTVINASWAENDFANALRAVAAFARIVPPSSDLPISLRAEITTAWALALQKAGDAGAVAKFRSAAADYTALSATAPDAETKVKMLRDAVPLYRQAGDNAAALNTINTLLQMPKLDSTTVALLSLSKAELLPASDFKAVKDCLELAMGSPGPAQVPARMKLATLHLNRSQELGANVAGAIDPDAQKKESEAMARFGRDLLRQVADAVSVNPEERAVHEQALFELGRLHLRDAKFSEAESRFKKQLNLYPVGRYAGYGRLWLVCSLLQQTHNNESAKRIYEEALGYLKPLAQSSDPYLRTYGEIWTANTLLELGDTAAVVTRTKDLMQKYRGKPEELVAGKLLFYAYLKQASPEPLEASRTLVRLEAAFALLPPTAYPNDPEYSHARWKTELPRLREELRKFTPKQ